MPLVVLIACSATKLHREAPARELYASDLFRKSLAWAETLGGDRRSEGGVEIFVLSAAHGLVPPDQVIAPYDVTLTRMSAPQRRAWAQQTWRQLSHRLRQNTDILFLAGRLYRDDLVALMLSNGMPSRAIHAPMQGLGIGQQKAWLAQRLQHARRGTPDAQERSHLWTQ